mgnify:CR=1 FL=1
MRISSRMIGKRRAWTVDGGRMRCTIGCVRQMMPFCERDSRAWWPFWGAFGGGGVIVVISTQSP